MAIRGEYSFIDSIRVRSRFFDTQVPVGTHFADFYGIVDAGEVVPAGECHQRAILTNAQSPRVGEYQALRCASASAMVQGP